MATVSFENDWGSMSFDSKNANFFSIQQGDNRVRVVSGCTMINTHYEKTNDGKFKSVPCTGEGCILCAHGSKPRTQYRCLVIDKSNWSKETGYKNGEINVKIATIPKTVARDIVSYAHNEDYGPVYRYDFKITKEGEKLNTVYTTQPSPHISELTDEEKEAISNAPSVQDVTKIPTNDEIKGMNLAILGGTPAPSSESKAKETKSKDSDWDDFD